MEIGFRSGISLMISIVWVAYLALLALAFVWTTLVECCELIQKGSYGGALRTGLRSALLVPVFFAVYLVAVNRTGSHQWLWRIYLAGLIAYVIYIVLSQTKPNIKNRLKQEFRGSPGIFCFVLAILLPALIALVLCAI